MMESVVRRARGGWCGRGWEGGVRGRERVQSDGGWVGRPRPVKGVVGLKANMFCGQGSEVVGREVGCRAG